MAMQLLLKRFQGSPVCEFVETGTDTHVRFNDAKVNNTDVAMTKEKGEVCSVLLKPRMMLTWRITDPGLCCSVHEMHRDFIKVPSLCG